MAPSPNHIAIRQLIRKLSNTPDGYSVADSHGLPGADYSSQQTTRMIQTGELVRVKVPGHFLRFVRTQAQADTLKARLTALKGKRIRKPDKAKGSPPVPRSGPLRRLVVALAAAPSGATRTDCAHLEACDGAFSKCVQRLQAAGDLFRAKVQGHEPRFFARQADAAAWKSATPPHVAPHKPRAVKPKRTKAPKVAAPKAVKMLKASKPRLAKPERLSYAEIHFLRSAAGKPKVQPAPHANAEIVHTAQTRYSSRMMGLGRYEVPDMPVRRIGQPGFSMTVGAMA